MKVFLDTEFTNFDFPSLISIGLVSEAGSEFYAEVPYSTTECSEFVLEVVIPLLDNEPGCQHSPGQLKKRLGNWLRDLKGDDKELVVLFDSQTDWDLFEKALDFQLPDWCHGKFVATDLDDSGDQDFYIFNMLEEHHALNDARAGLSRFLKSKY